MLCLVFSMFMKFLSFRLIGQTFLVFSVGFLDLFDFFRPLNTILYALVLYYEPMKFLNGYGTFLVVPPLKFCFRSVENSFEDL